MILIIGDAGQGKLDYVLQKTGCGPAQVARAPGEARTQPILAGLGDWPRPNETALLGASPGVILICGEMDCGVMPVESAQRTHREATGRLCCRLTVRAGRVERIFYGLPMVLKGEGSWN